MSANFFRRLPVIALALSTAIPFNTLQAQNTPSVLEQFQAQYTMARGTDGCHIAIRIQLWRSKAQVEACASFP